MNNTNRNSLMNQSGISSHARLKMLISCLLFFLFFSIPGLNGQNDTVATEKSKKEPPEIINPIFNSDELLEVSLYFDMATFLKKNPEDGNLDALMRIKFSETDSLEKKINMRTRGINRLERCPFPPVMVTFKKPVYISSDSVKVKKLKLVTHCETGAVYEEYVLREYLVYKLYNVITDTSFKVRLLKVNYIDNQNKRKTLSKYGFFIEPLNSLAARTNTTVVKATNLGQKLIIPEIMDQVAVFNYMIANWDWSVAGQHNINVVSPKQLGASPLGIAIPYDFDLTGIVNASFAIPPPDKGIESVRDRLYTGICRTSEEFRDGLKKFYDKKEELYKVVNDFQYLNPRAKKDIIYFLDGFFDQFEKERSFDNLIDLLLNNCKKL